jgi:hypothetical protein
MPNPMDAMCWVSPADEKGNIDNLSTRVARLEEIIALLTGMDISALQLSDITAKAGVLQNLAATASNAAGGWTTSGTFTGTAISTLGWKMSDGNEFPIVTMVDGVLQFGFGRNGQVAGTKPDQWDAAYQNYLTSYQQDYGVYNNLGEDLRGVTVDSFSNGTQTTTFNMNVTKSGLYFVHAWFVKPYITAGAGARVNANFQINTFGSSTPMLGASADFESILDASGNGTVAGSLSCVGLMDITIEDTVSFYVDDSAGTGDPCDGYGMSLFRISN